MGPLDFQLESILEGEEETHQKERLGFSVPG